jgi:beta-N-acetylhexosaminidase
MEVLRARELVPFVAAVAAGSVAVMTSHVVLQALGAALPATLSRRVLDLLRGDVGFDGLVVSDALDMAGASAGRGVPAAAMAAIDAGCDRLCLGADGSAADVDAVVAALVEAVEAGELAEHRLASAADKVQAARQRIEGLREAAARGGGPLSSAGLVAEGLAAAREVARRAVVVDLDEPLPDLRGVPVLRFRTGANVAVGQVPWGLPLDGSVLGGRQPVDLSAATDLEEVMRTAIGPADRHGGELGDRGGGRPVVALVREAHRHAWVLDALRTVAAACPDLVTVEMGWPGGARLPGRATVRTYGASRVNGEALDARLTGTPPDGALTGTPSEGALTGTPPEARLTGTASDTDVGTTPTGGGE